MKLKGIVLICALSLMACSTGGGAGETGADNEVEDTVEISMMTHLLSDAPDMENEFYTELEQLTGVSLDINWVLVDDYDERFDLVMASGDIPEIIVQGNFRRPTLLQGIEQGAFWDLTDFLGDFSQYPNLRDNLTPGAWNYVHYDGKIMGVPRSRANIDHGLMIRKDWLDELDLAIPETLDEFYDALLAITEEKDDVIGMLNDPLGGSNMGSLWH